jgi:hypothetical protein
MPAQKARNTPADDPARRRGCSGPFARVAPAFLKDWTPLILLESDSGIMSGLRPDLRNISV